MAAVETYVSDLVKQDVSGLLNACLSLDQVGQRQSLRVELEDMMDELEVEHNPTPLEPRAVAHKKAVLEVCCRAAGRHRESGKLGYGAAWTDFVCTSLANSDWGIRRGKMLHKEWGCCANREITVWRCKVYLVPHEMSPTVCL